MANEVSKIYTDIAELLNVARTKAYHTVNSIMVETYWKIGQRIVEEEQGGASRAEYGTKLIENLSKYLTVFSTSSIDEGSAYSASGIPPK